MQLDEFLRMTPYLFRLKVDAYIESKKQDNDFQKWLMWHGAVLTRVKKVPSLEKILGDKETKNVKMTKGRDIIGNIKSYMKVKNGKDT